MGYVPAGKVEPVNLDQMIARERNFEIRNFEGAAWITDEPQILWQARFALGMLDED